MFKKKYPWSKSESAPMKCVYAGPEYYNKKENNDVQVVPSPSDAPATDGVYAGPEFFGMEANDGADAGSTHSDDPVMEEVYAGPEFFGAPTDDPTDEGEFSFDDAVADGADDGVSPDEKQTEDVDLLPPDGIFPQPPPEMFMATYAGPEFFSNNGGGAFAPAPIPDAPAAAQVLEGDMIYCPSCGMAIHRAKFCSECGTVLPEDSGR